MLEVSINQNAMESINGRDLDVDGDPYEITYVSAPCGAGKTYALAHYLKDALSRNPFDEPQQFMYVAPTIDLLEEFSSRLTDLGVVAQRIIAGLPGQKDVFERVTRHLRNPDLYDASHVTLITHKTFLRLPVGLRHPERWRIFIDEVPQSDEFQFARLPKTRDLLSDYLDGKSLKEGLVRIDKKPRASIKRLLEMRDTGIDAMREMLHKIESPNYTVYTDGQSFDRVFNPTQANCDPTFSLPLLAVVNPDIFDGCCFLAANFEDSMLFDLLKRHKKGIALHQALTKGLRYDHYHESVGQRASIKYVLEGTRYSKSCRDKLTLDGRPLKLAIDETILAHLGTEPFLLVANKDDKGPLVNAPNAERLSGSPHGLNCFQTHTRIVFLAALNRSGKHLAMLGNAGFTQDTIRRATLVEAVHQSVMRTALRDASSSASVEIVVQDAWTAKQIGQVLGCRNICKLGNISLDTLEPYNPRERNRRYNFQKALRSLPAVGSDQGGTEEDHEDNNSAANSLLFLLDNIGKCHDSAAIEEPIATNTSRSGIQFTLHDSIYSSAPEEHAQVLLPFNDFLKILKVAARTPIARKEEHPLFTPSIFKSGGTKGCRTKDNFLSSSCLVLDFDGGSLSPETFETIFWKDAGACEKRTFIIYNTFSRAASDPNRFRVIMPFARPVTSIEVFEAIFEAIAERIEDAGYCQADAKLDKVGRNPTQPYYLPCTNRHHKDQAFIRSYGTQTKDIERYAINPTAYEVTLPRYINPLGRAQARRSNGDKNDSAEARAHIDSVKQALKSMSSNRHQLYFELGVLMARKYRYPLDEVEEELLDVAGSDQKMRRKARDILRSLTRSRRT